MSYVEPSEIYLSCPGLFLGLLLSPWKEDNITESDLSCPITSIQNKPDELPLPIDTFFHLHYENGLDDCSVVDIHNLNG